MSRGSKITIAKLGLKKVIHFPHQLNPLTVLINEGCFHLDCTKTDFPHAMHLSTSIQDDIELGDVKL